MDILRPVLHPIPQFCRVFGVGKTKTYELIAEGKLRTVKVGRKTLVTDASARACLLGEAA